MRLITSGTENPSLSRQAVVDAIVDGKRYKDANGQVRPIRLDRLLVSPKNYDLAVRIIESPGVQGTDTIDKNPLQGRVQVVEWERLDSDSSGTDKSDYFFMYDSRLVSQSLAALFSERPSLDAPEQITENRNWDYPLDYFYTIARKFPAYIRGSKGTNAA